MNVNNENSLEYSVPHNVDADNLWLNETLYVNGTAGKAARTAAAAGGEGEEAQLEESHEPNAPHSPEMSPPTPAPLAQFPLPVVNVRNLSQVELDRADSDRSFSVALRRRSLRRPRTIYHERDHDVCPSIALRRCSFFLRQLRDTHRTSPVSLSNILVSFSIKNDFMFYPPPMTYAFAADSDPEVGMTVVDRSENAKSLIKEGKLPRHIDAYCYPDFHVGATHAFSADLEEPHAATFKIAFIPWANEVHSYRVDRDELILEQSVRVGAPLFRLSFGCPIPCSIIRPHHRMSSHVALFFHCNGEDIGRSASLRLLALANALHITIFVPEYPGYGLFEGKPSEASIKGSMERVVQYLFATDATLTPSRLVLIGHSIGTGVAMHIASFIQEIFEKFQGTCSRRTVCPCAFEEDLERTNKKGYFDTLHDAESMHSTREPYGSKGKEEAHSAPHSPHSPHRPPRDVVHCHHYALGGIILLSAFASVHSVEFHDSLHKYKLHPEGLELRRLRCETNTVLPAPLEWAENVSTVDPAEVRKANAHVPQSPILYRISRFISFNRFPTLEVAAHLQNKYHFFNRTPLLLVHGTEDTLIPPFNAVAIATKIRQSDHGASARVFLTFVPNCGHNNLNCVPIIRRFYKDEILFPHLRRQEDFWHQMHRTIANFPRDADGGSPLGIRRQQSNGSFAARISHANTHLEERADDLEDPLPLVRDPLHGSDLYFLPPNRPPNAEERDAMESFHNTMRSHPPESPTVVTSREMSDLCEMGVVNGMMHDMHTRLCNTETSVMPASNMIHIALHPPKDCLDVGSVAVTSLLSHALPPGEAYRLRRLHLQHALQLRICRASLLLLVSVFLLAIAIEHGVLLEHGRMTRYLEEHNLVVEGGADSLSADARVIVWAVLESVLMMMEGILVLLQDHYSTGRASKRAVDEMPAVTAFWVARLFCFALIIGIGILMGMILAFTNHKRGGVDWEKWSVLPYDRRVWVSYLPRWMMLSGACLHMLIFTFVIVKNH